MSEASKSIALAHAISALGSKATPEEIISTAAEFHEFIVSDGATKPVKAPVKATTATKPAAPKKPVKPAPVDDDEDEADDETETEDETDEDEDGITKDQVGESIAALIDNDQKDDAIAILKKHGAKSMSTLDAKHYEAVKKAADKKLSIA